MFFPRSCLAYVKITSVYGPLRGNASELASLAARCHAAYSVYPSPNPEKYAVTHTAAVYVFNKNGEPEFIIAGLASRQPNLPGITRDLRHLVDYDRI